MVFVKLNPKAGFMRVFRMHFSVRNTAKCPGLIWGTVTQTSSVKDPYDAVSQGKYTCVEARKTHITDAKNTVM